MALGGLLKFTRCTFVIKCQCEGYTVKKWAVKIDSGCSHRFAEEIPLINKILHIFKRIVLNIFMELGHEGENVFEGVLAGVT